MKRFAFRLKALFFYFFQVLLITNSLRFSAFLVQGLVTFESQATTNSKLLLFAKFDQKFALSNLKKHITHIKSKVHFIVEQIFLFHLK